jgi:hypothetical protein
MDLPHTPLTYHRTWETGLGVEIRVATFSPAFFCLFPDHFLHITHLLPKYFSGSCFEASRGKSVNIL